MIPDIRNYKLRRTAVVISLIIGVPIVIVVAIISSIFNSIGLTYKALKNDFIYLLPDVKACWKK